MFCPKCGKELSDTARVCGNCGHKFEKSGNKKWISSNIIAVLGCCVCLLIFVKISLFYASQASPSDWDYRVYDGRAEITGYHGEETEIVIPETVEQGQSSCDVISIGDSAFWECSSLTSIEIPDSVTEIGDSAFEGCSSLTSIEIPGSVIEIGDSAFGGCSSLTSIEIPGSVTEIGYEVFWGCSSLASIEIPGSVTEIGGGAFSGCSSLTNIEIPDSVTEIGYDVFWGCSSLTSIELPEGFSVYDGMFGYEVRRR